MMRALRPYRGSSLRSFEHELQEDGALFSGTVEIEDTSFDHALGTERQYQLVCHDFAVIIWINGIDITITGCVPPKMLANYKERFLASAYNAWDAV